MPNHIQNRLQIIGEENSVKKLLNSISSKDEKGEAVQIDFNKIIPMPQGLDVQTHSQVIEWAEICTCQIDFSVLFGSMNLSAAFKDGKYGDVSNRLKASTAMETITGKRKNLKAFSDEEFDQFIQCVKNVRQTGFTTWYEWSVKSWGTKWNAYDQNDKRNTNDTIFFQTAWSSPLPVILELSKQHPDCEIKISYADEDSGSNVGVVTLKNGKAIKVFQPESQSKEAYEIYFELHPDSKQNYKLIGEKYEYVDEED